MDTKRDGSSSKNAISQPVGQTVRQKSHALTRRRRSRNLVTRINVGLSCAALLVSTLAAWFAYNQNQIAARQLHLHIRPELQIQVLLSSDGDSVRPLILVTNRSPVPALSVSANYQTVDLEEEAGQFIISGSMTTLPEDKDLKRHLIFQRKLEPNDHASAQIGEQFEVKGLGSCTHALIIYVRYHHEADLDAFDKKALFFLVRGELLTEQQFEEKHPGYVKIRSTLHDIPQYDFHNMPPIAAEVLDRWKAPSQPAPGALSPPSGLRISRC